MQRKRRAAALLFFLAVLVSGCSAPPQELPPPPRQGVTLRVACPGDPVAAVVRDYGRGWELRQNAHITIVPYDPAKGIENCPADVWVVPPAELPRLAAANLLEELPNSFR